MNNESQIIEYVQKLRSQNREKQVFITRGVQKLLRNVIEIAKKNYQSVFGSGESAENPSNKLFVPLTKTYTDALAANLDFDVADIRLTAVSGGKQSIVELLRLLLQYHMRKHGFGQFMNEALTSQVLLGTAVAKTTQVDGHPSTTLIDLENFVTDENTNKPKWFLERTLVSYATCQEYGWDVVRQNASLLEEVGQTNRDEVEMWNFEGFCPTSFITGNPEHTKEILMRIVLTGLTNGQKAKVQSTELIKEFSYDYAQLIPDSGRFTAIGMGEALFGWQSFVNELYNERRNLSRLHARGVYQIRKGSGITPDMIDSIVSGGAIPVSTIGGDVAPVSISGTNNDNFNEENRAFEFLQRQTGVTPISQGMQDKSGATLGEVQLTAGYSNTRFKFMRQNFAFFIESILKKWTKIIVDNMGAETIIDVSDENVRRALAEEFTQLEIKERLRNAVQVAGLRGFFKTVDDLSNGLAQNIFDKHFKTRTLPLLKKSLKDIDYVLDISVTSEHKNVDQKTKNLLELLRIAQTMGLDSEPIVETIFGDLGIAVNQFKAKGNTAPVVNQLIQQ